MSATPELIVIGASNGGLAALKQIFAGLPPEFPAAILVTMHVGNHESVLPDILLSYSALAVRHAADSEPINPGTVLIAPPDHHLLVEPGRALHEKESLLKQFEKRALEDKRPEVAAEHAAAADRTRQHAAALRRMASM